MARALAPLEGALHEVGRAQLGVDEKADSAKYLDFECDERTSLTQVSRVKPSAN